MASGLTPDVRVYPNTEALSRAAAHSLVEAVRNAVGDGSAPGAPAFSMALAGGSTPRALYRLLSTEHRDQIPWDRMHVFWGDERYVSWDDPPSNYRMAREALFDHVPLPSQNVHPMPTNLSDPDAAARSYEATLRVHFPGPWPRFDLILLGLGADAHTASLFPGSPALEERDRWVVAARVPVEPSVRLTFTLPVLNHAARVWFLVAGADKAHALQHVLTDAPRLRSRAAGASPAAAVRPNDGTLTWWVDSAASTLLSPRIPPRKARQG